MENAWLQHWHRRWQDGLLLALQFSRTSRTTHCPAHQVAPRRGATSQKSAGSKPGARMAAEPASTGASRLRTMPPE